MTDAIRKAREAYGRQGWREAFETYASLEPRDLEAGDLERLATAAYLLGRDDAHREALEQAHHAHLDAGEVRAAVRCAFWLGLTLLFRGDTGAASGWLGRAARLLERVKGPCAEAGYLMIPVAEQKLAGGNRAEALRIAGEAATIGERLGDADLAAAARHQQGRALLLEGRIPEGLALLDETMIAVVSGELSPVMTGLLYCSVIDACCQVWALARAREWTQAMSRWCARQPDLAAFRGTCLVHRAEILQLEGAWEAALAEAGAACAWPGSTVEANPTGAALYQQAEVHRLRGAFDTAERAYREAALRGHEPQPGLALLRLAQGRVAESQVAIQRVLDAARDAQARARLLPSYVEIMVAAREQEAARSGCEELEHLARHFCSPVLAAAATYARGVLELGSGQPEAALATLRSAWKNWDRLGSPYAAARAREQIGHACAALGDREAAAMELDAARSAFEALGAGADLARLNSPGHGHREPGGSTLTERESNVLRLVAAGKTNKGIARELRLSVKTVDRHLSNIFTKLEVSSRAAAIARAYERRLI